ncbi:hypothetical protein DFH06DRAFT_1145112 [Mycena polygramma]|nr:hypothetical protein DFH06DRAFT_1145112 [Mycena polygramma]
MSPNAATELKNLTLVEQNKTAVVVGGTTGNGGGIARRLVQLGCRRVIICAHDEARGNEVVEELKKLAPNGSEIVVQFVLGDLSDVKGMRAAAAALQETAGDAGIDFLIMSQMGTPTGSIKENADRHDTAFAIQCISRFALAYLLTVRGALAPNAIVMSIYYHWGHSLDDLSVDDLSLKRRVGTLSKTNFHKAQTRRDCTVLDSVTQRQASLSYNLGLQELNLRFPQYRYFSLWPGLVKGDFSTSEFPTYLKAVVWLGSKTLAVKPEEYANVPIYILVSPDAPRTLGADKYFDQNLNPGTSMLGDWARDTKNRVGLWEKLKGIIGEKTLVSRPILIMPPKCRRESKFGTIVNAGAPGSGITALLVSLEIHPDV